MARRRNAASQQLESPLNTPKFKADLDTQARTALTKGSKGQLGRQERIKRDQDQAERASYKLNRKQKF